MEPRRSYPSDVSREQFERILPLLEGVRKRTKPRTVDLHEVFNAVLYLLKSGCQWRMLPEGFPKWRTVHSYFVQWSEAGPDGTSVLERALKKQVGVARAKQGRNVLTSFLIVDAQSVKNADPAEQKGYDAGKKVSGIKAPHRSRHAGPAPCHRRDHGGGDRPQRRFAGHRPLQTEPVASGKRIGRRRLHRPTLRRWRQRANQGYGSGSQTQ